MEEERRFTDTEMWQKTKKLFLIGRVFGVSYLTKESRGKPSFLGWILRIYSGIIGIFLLVNIGAIFSALGEAQFLSSHTFTTLLIGAYLTFCLINWAFALYFQSHIPALCQMHQKLRQRGYKISANIDKLIYGIYGCTLVLMVADAIVVEFGANGDIDFPSAGHYLKIPILNGIFMAWMAE